MAPSSRQAAFRTNLKSLECFRSIIETGSATAAAQKLGLTQPAVSRLLSVLEDQLGFELFDRRQARLVPKPEAQALYKEVDMALASLERITQLAGNLQNADFGELAIVSPPSLAEGILSHVIAEFISKYPNVRVSLDSHSMEKTRDMVSLRAADCGFIKLPAEFPGIHCTPLVSAGTVCALPAKHRLSRLRKIGIRDLERESLVLLGKGTASRIQLDEAFRKAGIRMRTRMEVHTVGAACAVARRGVGIAIVNEMLATQFAGRGLVLRRFSPNFRHEYGFITSSEVPMNRVTRNFHDSCVAYFSENRDSFIVT